jgi:hypothetical protein
MIAERNTMTNDFRTIMGLDEESTPTTTETKEATTFQKVVYVAAGVGVIAGAALVTMTAADHLTAEVVGGVKAAKAWKANRPSKLDKQVAEREAFAQSLKAAGWDDARIEDACKNKYGF